MSPTRLAIGALIVAFGCGESTEIDDAGSGGPPCGALGHGTTEEIAATPRANERMELLAIALSEGVTADPAIYERVTRDVEAIGAGYPEVAGITYRGFHDGTSLILQADRVTADRIEAGDYVAEWDCLNAHYGLESVQVNDGVSLWVHLVLKGCYDMELVAEDYMALPGIELAQPDGLLGDGPTICAEIEGDTYHYVFDDASGDCPAGCIDHVYTYFTTAADGAIERIGSATAPVGTPGPDWIDICRR